VWRCKQDGFHPSAGTMYAVLKAAMTEADLTVATRAVWVLVLEGWNFPR
jgi:hypothetical protein